MALVHLALSLTLLAPQGGEPADARLTTALTQTEQDKLNKAAKKWFAVWEEHKEESNAKLRGRLRKKLVSAKAKFMKEWQAREKKAPLKHAGDLLAVFDNVFPYPRQSGTGEMKAVGKGDDAFWVAAPKGYKNTDEYPCVVLLPSRVDGGWTDAKDYYENTWKGGDFAAGALFVSPKLDDGLELDPIPDMSTDAGDTQEITNNGALLRPVLGKAQYLYRMDLDRLILDCGKGASGFGLRVATHFPARFSGLILRHPVDVGGLRLDSLTGMPVLIIADQDTKAAGDKIAKALNGLQAGACKVLEAKGAAPYTEMAEDIGAWAKTVRRDLFRPKVVVAPNQDRWLKSYWVEVLGAESVFSTAPDQRAYLSVEADRDSNRITVTARNVATFRLYLGDALLDLDKDFTVVVNGEAITETRQRSLYKLTELIFAKRDPSYVFTTDYAVAVPKANGSSQGEK